MPRWEPLTDDQRFPLIPEAGRGLLRHLRQHPQAPRWNLAAGDRLDAPTLAALRAWREEARRPPFWAEGEQPPWLEERFQRARAEVPFYRERAGATLAETPSFRRADLARQPWAFVPDGAALDELLVFATSGTTGPAFDVYSHPFAASAPLALLEAALGDLGITLEAGPERVSLASVHHQRGTYTYPSLMSFFGGAGYVKVNLHPDEWRAPGDAVAFLDATAPEVYLGDPLAFDALSRLPLRHRPRALVSSAMTLRPGLRAALEAHFRCPILDLYSLTEARLLAVDTGVGMAVRAPDVFIEVLDPMHDTPMAPGQRGEITVTGGCNPLLPLLRYRTGDFGRLEHSQGRVWIRDLEGRPPVALLDAQGALVNTIDASRSLAPFALPQLQLAQAADRSLTLRVRGEADEALLRAALAPLFGDLPLSVTGFPAHLDPGRKVLQYVSEVTPPPELAAVFGDA